MNFKNLPENIMKEIRIAVKYIRNVFNYNQSIFIRTFSLHLYRLVLRSSKKKIRKKINLWAALNFISEVCNKSKRWKIILFNCEIIWWLYLVWIPSLRNCWYSVKFIGLLHSLMSAFRWAATKWTAAVFPQPAGPLTTQILFFLGRKELKQVINYNII